MKRDTRKVICPNSELIQKINSILFSDRVSIPSEHFCTKSRRSGHMWDIQHKLPHEKDILSFVLST